MKMKIEEQAKVRAQLYSYVEEILNDYNMDFERVCEGTLVHLPDGQYAKIKISICDAEKFSLVQEREKYAEKTCKAAERAEIARKKAEEKANKLKAKAEKAAEKIGD